MPGKCLLFFKRSCPNYFDDLQGLTLGQNYDYRVAAITANNTSGFSNTVSQATEFPAPSGLAAISVSDIEIQLSWIDNTGFESGFKIERDSGSGFAEVGTVSADVTEFRDTGLTVDQFYDYRVAAFTSTNTSSWVIIVTMTEFPAPSNLTASSVNDSEIHLTWTDNTGYETGFKIERDVGSGFEEIGTVLADVNEYTDAGLTYGQSYIYRVAAYTSVNTSSWVTITATTVFPAPAGLSATPVSDSEIELTWIDNTAYETGFKIERDVGSSFVEIGTVLANVNEYTDTGLTYRQSYNYRVAAYSVSSTSDYSDIATATAIGPLIDYDGNVYQTIQIGDQVWMAENLKVTHYRDGTAITHITDGTAWTNLSTEAYCIYYNNQFNELDTYGALYNWYAVANVHNIAPEGWHVPTDAEWKELEMALGMSQSEADVNSGWRGTNEGSKLAGNGDLWGSGGALENDSEFGVSGFTALPGGRRYYDYNEMGEHGFFWSATEAADNAAWYRELMRYSSTVYRSGILNLVGCSVRLLRD